MNNCVNDSCSAGTLAGKSSSVIDFVEVKGVSFAKGVKNVGGLVGLVTDGYLRKTSSISSVEEVAGGGGENFGGLVGNLYGKGVFINPITAVQSLHLYLKM